MHYISKDVNYFLIIMNIFSWLKICLMLIKKDFILDFMI